MQLLEFSHLETQEMKVASDLDTMQCVEVDRAIHDRARKQANHNCGSGSSRARTSCAGRAAGKCLTCLACPRTGPRRCSVRSGSQACAAGEPNHSCFTPGRDEGGVRYPTTCANRY